MIDIIVDTNVLVSIIDSKDKWNATTLGIINQIENKKEKINLIFLDIVINESINVLLKRYESKGMLEKVDEMIDLIEENYNEFIIWASENVEDYHKDILKKIKDYKGLLNYNDSFIIEYMERNNIRNIISYDIDFDQIELINRICNVDLKL